MGQKGAGVLVWRKGGKGVAIPVLKCSGASFGGVLGESGRSVSGVVVDRVSCFWMEQREKEGLFLFCWSPVWVHTTFCPCHTSCHWKWECAVLCPAVFCYNTLQMASLDLQGESRLSLTSVKIFTEWKRNFGKACIKVLVTYDGPRCQHIVKSRAWC